VRRPKFESRPTNESREAQKPDDALFCPPWPVLLPLSMLTPVSIWKIAFRPLPRSSVPRRPTRELLSKMRRRLLRSTLLPEVQAAWPS